VSWRVLVRGAAEADLEQTRRWYNEQRAGLGDEFLVSIVEAFTRLEQDPERYRVLYNGFRRVLVEIPLQNLLSSAECRLRNAEQAGARLAKAI